MEDSRREITLYLLPLLEAVKEFGGSPIARHPAFSRPLSPVYFLLLQPPSGDSCDATGKERVLHELFAKRQMGSGRRGRPPCDISSTCRSVA
jgi:hypothetical protein